MVEIRGLAGVAGTPCRWLEEGESREGWTLPLSSRVLLDARLRHTQPNTALSRTLFFFCVCVCGKAAVGLGAVEFILGLCQQRGLYLPLDPLSPISFSS